VKIGVRERLANTQKIPRRKTRRWDVEKLHKDIAQRDRYQKVLDLKQKKNGRRRKNRQCTKRWEHLEQAMKIVAEETIGEIKYKKKEE
jgi:hypothetical protein